MRPPRASVVCLLVATVTPEQPRVAAACAGSLADWHALINRVLITKIRVSLVTDSALADLFLALAALFPLFFILGGAPLVPL